jgi:hypothetical protein
MFDIFNLPPIQKNNIFTYFATGSQNN